MSSKDFIMGLQKLEGYSLVKIAREIRFFCRYWTIIDIAFQLFNNAALYK